MYFSNNLIEWYLQNKREMPWRKTTNPYKIWLSEIILQQTRVAQGLPYYLRFIEHFPTVQDLAAASQEEVLKLWQGLGYYSRGRNLHTSAQIIVSKYGGKFPTTYSEIKKLKGIGDYTASAIASISFNEPTAVVDGNVYRVLSRFFGIATPINSTEGIKEFKALAQKLIDPDQPATFNQAIMEFGAIQCKPQNPYCLHCVFQSDCVALQTNKITELPVKIKKTKVKKRYLNYLVFRSVRGHTIFKQRTGKGIWQGLYEFPYTETKKTVGSGTEEVRFCENLKSLEITQELNLLDIARYNDSPITHKLSHQHLFVTFWIIEVEDIPNGTNISSLSDFPVSVLIGSFIKGFS